MEERGDHFALHRIMKDEGRQNWILPDNIILIPQVNPHRNVKEEMYEKLNVHEMLIEKAKTYNK